MSSINTLFPPQIIPDLKAELLPPLESLPEEVQEMIFSLLSSKDLQILSWTNKHFRAKLWTRDVEKIKLLFHNFFPQVDLNFFNVEPSRGVFFSKCIDQILMHPKEFNLSVKLLIQQLVKKDQSSGTDTIDFQEFLDNITEANKPNFLLTEKEALNRMSSLNDMLEGFKDIFYQKKSHKDKLVLAGVISIKVLNYLSKYGVESSLQEREYICKCLKSCYLFLSQLDYQLAITRLSSFNGWIIDWTINVLSDESLLEYCPSPFDFSNPLDHPFYQNALTYYNERIRDFDIYSIMQTRYLMHMATQGKATEEQKRILLLEAKFLALSGLDEACKRESIMDIMSLDPLQVTFAADYGRTETIFKVVDRIHRTQKGYELLKTLLNQLEDDFFKLYVLIMLYIQSIYFSSSQWRRINPIVHNTIPNNIPYLNPIFLKQVINRLTFTNSTFSEIYKVIPEKLCPSIKPDKKKYGQMAFNLYSHKFWINFFQSSKSEDQLEKELVILKNIASEFNYKNLLFNPAHLKFWKPSAKEKFEKFEKFEEKFPEIKEMYAQVGQQIRADHPRPGEIPAPKRPKN